jgi:23S rRNA pseudouridine2605 synthase
MPEPQRIAKLLARAGIASRREIERMIAEGRVAIDGVAVEKPGTLLASLKGVTVDGQPVKAAEPARLFIYHKPPGLLVTERDPRGRPTIYDRLPKGLPRVVPVGRLDLATEGLLLLTTDGELAHRLAHPSYEVKKTYLAQVSGSVPRDLHRRLRAGVELDDGPVAVDSFRVVDTHAGQSVVEVVLHEGRKHIVRRLLDHVGLPVSRLTRTAVGPIELRAMRSGTIRKLSREEIGALQEAVGL